MTKGSGSIGTGEHKECLTYLRNIRAVEHVSGTYGPGKMFREHRDWGMYLGTIGTGKHVWGT